MKTHTTPYVKWQFRDDEKARWEEGCQFMIITRYPRVMKAIECYLQLHPNPFINPFATFDVHYNACYLNTHRSESQYNNACATHGVDQTRRSAIWWMRRYKDVFDFALKQGAVIKAEGVGWPVVRAGNEYHRWPKKNAGLPVKYATDKEHIE